MSMETPDKITAAVNILDKEYMIACPTEEKSALIEAAAHLDKRMREISDSGKVMGIERISVMAALYIAHEMITSKRQGPPSLSETENHIQSMLELLDNALEDSPNYGP